MGIPATLPLLMVVGILEVSLLLPLPLLMVVGRGEFVPLPIPLLMVVGVVGIWGILEVPPFPLPLLNVCP